MFDQKWREEEAQMEKVNLNIDERKKEIKSSEKRHPTRLHNKEEMDAESSKEYIVEKRFPKQKQKMR